MIPASILLIILVAADLISHVSLWMRATHQDERAEAMIHEAMNAELSSRVKLSDYERNQSDVEHEIKRLRAWSKMPDEFKF